MPLEYYLGGAVAVIVLILLFVALTGKKPTRRVVVAKTTDSEELTRQVARAADALEALLAHLKAHPFQGEAPTRAAASPRSVEVPVQAPPTGVVQKTPEPQVPPMPVSPESIASKPLAVEPATPEFATTAEAEPAGTSAEQKPRRVKLSMFGR
ncbi:MAG TPA: hypothetical protein VIY69_08455 [Candidatus Acidoferrales bacterium]